MRASDGTANRSFTKWLPVSFGRPIVHALPTLLVGLFSSPVLAAELVCEVIGTQYGEWRGNDYRLSQSKAYRRVQRLAFVTGDQPRIGYPGKQQASWVWKDLKAIPLQTGMFYSGVLPEGMITAALNDAETRIVVNYLGKPATADGEGPIYSTTGVGQCFRRQLPNEPSTEETPWK